MLENGPRTDPRPVRLEPGLQHYAWGDTEFIPELLGVPNPDRRPHAELWLGAHPGLPARAEIDGELVPLDDVLERGGEWLLGAQVARRFGGLPYLLKVLAAAQPLSIQVHPTRSQAEEGFLRENSSGISLSAPERNYRDRNHKPELIVAVSEFFALSGFRPSAEISSVLAGTPELGEVAADFRPDDDGIRALFERLMSLPQERVDGLLTPLLDRLRRQNDERAFPGDDPSGWLLRADHHFSRQGHRDRGLFSFLLLNLVHLAPGQALFTDAGTLHAYLEGVGIEIMASSDNVLRCGLTPKHIDVPELLRIVRFHGERPRILEATRVPDGPEWVYRTPASEFELSRLELTAGQSWQSVTAQGGSILLVLDLEAGGVVRVTAGPGALELGRGGACFLPHGTRAVVEATHRTTIFRAVVPATSRGGDAQGSPG